MNTQINPFNSIDQRFDRLEIMLNSLHKVVSTSTIPHDINPHERLTRHDIADQYRVSLGTIHNAMKSRKLPFEKVGRKTIFRRTDVEAWMGGKK